jgi:hypothetical protein
MTAVLAVIFLGTIAAASGYWRGSGTGSGSAATGTVQAVTLSPATATAELYPGGQAGVVLTVTNPNPGSVRVLSLALADSLGTGGFAVDAGHAGCGLSTLSFTTQTNGGAGWTIAGNAALSISLAGSLSMSTSAANACQGAVFTVYLTATS